MLSINFKRSKSLINIKNSKGLSPIVPVNSELCGLYPDYQDNTDCYSTENESCDLFQESFPKEESEDILISISKKQRKISDYSEDDNVAYSSREAIIDWAEKVLSSLELTKKERESIFFRFTTCFDLVMDKLFLEKNSIYSLFELKKMIVTIFLLTYKFEGFTIGSITISSFISAFFTSIDIDVEEMQSTIQQTELTILSLLDYNPFCFENNIHELSLILIDLIKKRFCISQGIIDLINSHINESNKNVVISDKILFDTFPIDKAAISLGSVIMYLKGSFSKDKDKETNNNKLLAFELEDLAYEFFKYLKNELKVLKLVNWAQFKQKCLFFENKFQ